MKRQSTRLLFILLIVTSCQEQDIGLKKEKLSKIAYTSLDKEPMLNQAIQKIGLSAKGKGIISGRIMDDISNYKADSILKVLQADNSNYTYTIPLDKNPDPKSFKNLVFKRISNGFLATVLDYVSENEFYDLDSFTGNVKVYNLAGVLLQEFYLNKAKLNSKSGRTQGCSVSISKECVSGGAYSTATGLALPCLQWATTIIVDCTSDGSGSGNNNSPLPYSFIPDVSYGGGAPGTGGQPANSYILYGPWAADPIAVLPPPIWPGSKLGMSYLWWLDDAWLDENFSLDPSEDYKDLTFAEHQLIKANPVAALLINKNKDKAYAETKRLFPNMSKLNTTADAFRHAFFNAMNERDCGKDNLTLESIAKKFSDAHESEVPTQLLLEKQMDLWNNSIGHNLGNVMFPLLTSDSDLSLAVMQKLTEGKLKYLSPIWYEDPNFKGTNGLINPLTATHGITSATLLIWSNQ
jgi:hypothetical protein